ncbi:MAG: 3'-5' exonuclease, partial [Flavobacteriales bacterium]
YFRLTCNPNDEEALKRVINYPARGIGQSTMDKLMVTANEHEKSIWAIIHDHLGEVGLHDGLKKKIAQFVMMIRSFQTMLETQNAYALGEYIARTTGLLQDLFIDKTPEGVSRYENIQELLNGMKEFSDPTVDSPTTEPGTDPDVVSDGEQTIRTLPDFLIDVALLTDADNNDPNDTDRVSLMTVHSSKGLEFPYVYVVGMEENLFPNMMAVQSRADLEEERRLFYVAITRAEKRATLSYATSRYKWGTLQSAEPSRFLQEIDPKFLQLPSRHEMPSSDGYPDRRPSFAERNGFVERPAASSTSTRSPLQERSRPATSNPAPPPSKRNLKKISPTGRPMEVTSTLGASPSEDIQEGVTVEHERFGRGKVVKVEGAPPDQKATIFFPSAGQKQLLLRFAKLKVVG